MVQLAVVEHVLDPFPIRLSKTNIRHVLLLAVGFFSLWGTFFLFGVAENKLKGFLLGFQAYSRLYRICFASGGPAGGLRACGAQHAPQPCCAARTRRQTTILCPLRDFWACRKKFNLPRRSSDQNGLTPFIWYDTTTHERIPQQYGAGVCDSILEKNKLLLVKLSKKI